MIKIYATTQQHRSVIDVPGCVRWLCSLAIVYALMTLFANRCALELLLYELYCYSAYTLVHVVCIFIHQPPPPERVICYL